MAYVGAVQNKAVLLQHAALKREKRREYRVKHKAAAAVFGDHHLGVRVVQFAIQCVKAKHALYTQKPRFLFAVAVHDEVFPYGCAHADGVRDALYKAQRVEIRRLHVFRFKTQKIRWKNKCIGVICRKAETAQLKEPVHGVQSLLSSKFRALCFPRTAGGRALLCKRIHKTAPCRTRRPRAKTMPDTHGTADAACTRRTLHSV